MFPQEVRAMERAAWLKQIRAKTEALYDHFSPRYWVKFGLYANETHQQYLQEFLERVPPHSSLLSAACGAGRYDGLLLEAGHSVVGIDQSEGMLARAREHFPEVQYRKMGLQEIDFREAFDGIICMDAMEHVGPEDWPQVLRRFQAALKPGGVLYFTVELVEGDDLEAAYERAKALDLPVVFGEVADKVDETYEQMKVLGAALPDELADGAVYHYHPSLEQVRAWVGQTGMAMDDEGTGNGYKHFLVRKR
jgi:cyclopropane fatty-acyl-phospholipid synthase-like methyltransferase